MEKVPPDMSILKQKISHDFYEEHIKTQLNDILYWTDQLKYLVRMLELSDQDMEYRTKLVDIIQNIATQEFGRATKVYLFGSTFSGLGMKGCDIDVYVETNIKNFSESEAVQRMANRLKTFQSSFENVVDIPNARVPIVKFSHIQTSLRCDISFKNQLSVLNTQFIKSCMDYDPRIRPITMCIRFWAMKYNLSGNGLEQKVNNYALTLMIIFYLQTQRMLPSVKSLQENVKKGIYIDKKLVLLGYEQDLSKWPRKKCQNRSTIELLEGFFVYFSSFNYQDYIISPYFGQTILLKNSHSKFKNIPICVQDPFEHDFCVTRNFATKQEAVYDWIEHFELTAKIIQDVQSTILHTSFNCNSNADGINNLIEIREKGNIARIFELHLPKRCEYTTTTICNDHPKQSKQQKQAANLESKQSANSNWFQRYTNTLELMMMQRYIEYYTHGSRMSYTYRVPPYPPPPPPVQQPVHPLYPRGIMGYPYGYANFR